MASVEVGPNFYNFRASFKILAGMADIGTHMSLIRLSNGKFLVIDTIQPTDYVRAEIDALTSGGSKIEAVIGTHPYHSLFFKAFYKFYPNAKYYGTPRHLATMPEIPWVGETMQNSGKWEPEVEMRIPDGSEYVKPLPPRSNHFSNVFVFHRASKTIHNDDTIIIGDKPGFLLRMFGLTQGKVAFHPSIKGPGLYPTPEAPLKFKLWMEKMLEDWDFDNVCSAHTGNKIGGAKRAVRELLENSDKLLLKISKRNEKKNPQVPKCGSWNGDEDAPGAPDCG